MRPGTFGTDEIYHIYNRGVEKRNVFSSDSDRLRFIYNLFEFNDTSPAENSGYSFQTQKQNLGSQIIKDRRENLVEILCFCAMPNHYHLLVRQKIDGGITEFMRKIGTGYTNYFNKKYDRVGPLFQGKFKAIHINNDAQFLYIPHYIHLNPLDLVMPEWRSGQIKNIAKASQFLESYHWSSYLDYIGHNNFPAITSRDLILSLYRSPTSIGYKNEIEEWIQDPDLESISDLVFDL
jgi:putative transposase